MVYARDSKSRLARDGSSSLPSGTEQSDWQESTVPAHSVRGLEGRSDVSLANETARRGREKFPAGNLLVTELPSGTKRKTANL